MISMAKIDDIEDWLIGQALGSPDMAKMFAEMCEKLRKCEVPVDRAMMAWSTLHPLIEAEVVVWESGSELQHELISHTDEETDDWLNSPVRAVLVNQEPRFRRRLTKSNAPEEFPLLTRLRNAGYTDYLVLPTQFALPVTNDDYLTSGIIVSWATVTRKVSPTTPCRPSITFKNVLHSQLARRSKARSAKRSP